MKVLLATINYDHPQRGMLHAFQGLFGERNVWEYDYLDKQRTGLRPEQLNEGFYSTISRYQPDWVWMQLQDTNVIQPYAIEEARRQCRQPVVFTHWTGDCRPTVSPYLSSICRATDLTLTSAKGQLPLFQAAGAHLVKYLQIGLDWDEDLFPAAPWVPHFEVPAIVFCGSYYGSNFPKGTLEREAAIRALQAAGLPVGIVGNGWPGSFPIIGACGVKEQVHVYRRAKVALNVNHFNDIERYYSDRQLIAMASGTPLVCRKVPGLEHEFLDHEDCVFFEDEHELVEHCRWLLDNPKKAQLIGECGRATVLQHHTWFSRILEVLPVVEEIRARR